MRIGILVPSIYMSPTKYPDMIFAPRDLAVEIADCLVERGHEVVLFATSDIETKAKIISGSWDLFPGNLRIEKLQGAFPDRVKWGTFFNLRREYEIELTTRAFSYARKNLDLLHIFHDTYSHYFDELTSFPCIYTLHDPLPQEGSLEYWRLHRFERHNYISISNAQRQDSSLNFIATVYHGLDLSQYHFSVSGSDYLAFAGRVVPEKGVDVALDAAKITKHQIKLAYDHHDEILKSSDYYQSEVKPRLASSNAQEIGFVTGKDKSDFFSHAKAFLFPIHWEEPFGLVMVEAMACGTPVIAFAQGSVPEVMKDGETGFIINVSDTDRRGNWTIKSTGLKGLIEAIKKLDGLSEDQYKNIRIACRRQVEKNFSVEKMVENYEKVYQRVITDCQKRKDHE